MSAILLLAAPVTLLVRTTNPTNNDERGGFNGWKLERWRWDNKRDQSPSTMTRLNNNDDTTGFIPTPPIGGYYISCTETPHHWHASLLPKIQQSKTKAHLKVDGHFH
mmetsp:Transcript_22341/g.38018  ORF Transcript_22341/g.38018 Transcript_22341/m.38018 type:complete len:107 (-) Transcript_22341:60-380(-)